MNPLEIKKTSSTPEISYNQETAVLSFNGRSFPENAKDFYTPVISWITDNKQDFPSEIIFEINLEYYNTSSSKFILEILHLFEKIVSEHSITVSVKWFYTEDDDDMKEAGEEFKQFIHLPFECIETE